MKAFTIFSSNRNDFVHDIAYDFYGKRLATCSSDMRIQIFDQSKNIHRQWEPVAEIKAHTGSVNKLAWAHPEFGQVLASCSTDRVVYIYEEQIDIRTGTHSWKKMGSLLDSRKSVEDIAFAPRHMGLKLATCSRDGHVRIYESNDIMNLSIWNLAHDFEPFITGCKCLSWNPSPFDPAMIAIGAAGDQSTINLLNNTHSASSSGLKGGVGTDAKAKVGQVSIWQYSDALRKFREVARLEGHTDEVNDVAWAPNMGRSYHLVATACKDKNVRIFKITHNNTTSTNASSSKGNPLTATATATATDGGASPMYSIECIACLDQHKEEVWRVSWNITGTMLASSGDDGTARLWKSDYQGKWHSSLVAEGQSSSSTDKGSTAGLLSYTPASNGNNNSNNNNINNNSHHSQQNSSMQNQFSNNHLQQPTNSSQFNSGSQQQQQQQDFRNGGFSFSSTSFGNNNTPTNNSNNNTSINNQLHNNNQYQQPQQQGKGFSFGGSNQNQAFSASSAAFQSNGNSMNKGFGFSSNNNNSGFMGF